MKKLKAICGKTFELRDIDPRLSQYPEYLCSRCSETSCEIYMNYFYWATHSNDPR